MMYMLLFVFPLLSASVFWLLALDYWIAFFTRCVYEIVFLCLQMCMLVSDNIVKYFPLNDNGNINWLQQH